MSVGKKEVSLVALVTAVLGVLGEEAREDASKG